jgi:alpha-glucosidase
MKTVATKKNWSTITLQFMGFLALVAINAPLPANSQLATGQAELIREELDQGVIRFFSDESARRTAEPSYALLNPSSTNQGPLAKFPILPIFTEIDKQESVTINVDPGTSLYGTGMVVGPLLRNGHVIQTWNLDAYAYGPDSQNLYQSHPWVLALRRDGSAYGVLADTTHRCVVDTTRAIVFTCVPSFPVIVINRSSPQEVVEELAKLTGYMPLPPKWALGYHQSRFSYTPASKVMDVAQTFRADRIPCDAIWMDIDYMDHYRIFSFDPVAFSDPRGLNENLRAMGFHNVWMIDPAVKREKGSVLTKIYLSGSLNDVWVRSADGSRYEGKVWPGAAVFPDFLNPSVRTWWGTFYTDFMAQGVAGVWNDMNEPAVFTTAPDNSKTMPLSNLHHGDPTLLDDLGQPQGDIRAAGTHERYHNVYGMMMARATREGIAAALPNKRPFVLARANYVGGQRYAASWTGDNTASWQHLEFAIPMVLNMGLSGQPFVGPDIGGYRYDQQGHPTQQQDARLYARWIGIGALLPFSRGHYEKGYPWDKEPWGFGNEVTDTSRLALQRRYRLMPYLYTLFEESSATGLPVARPLFFADSKDPRLRSVDDEFLLGADIIVAAQVQPDTVEAHVLPSGIWEEVAFPQSDATGTPKDDTDLDLPQLFVRGGAIVPTGPILQYVDEKPLNPLTLLVCLDEHGEARGELYEDAGDGMDYLAVGPDGKPGESQFLLTSFRARREGQRVIVSVERRDGKMSTQERSVVVRLLLNGTEFNALGSDAEPITVELNSNQKH